jgi:hypothetical protein
MIEAKKSVNLCRQKVSVGVAFGNLDLAVEVA